MQIRLLSEHAIVTVIISKCFDINNQSQLSFNKSAKVHGESTSVMNSETNSQSSQNEHYKLGTITVIKGTALRLQTLIGEI